MACVLRAGRTGRRIDQVVGEAAVAVLPSAPAEPGRRDPLSLADPHPGDRRGVAVARILDRRPGAARAPRRGRRRRRQGSPGRHTARARARGPAGHPALGDPAEIEPRPGRDLHRSPDRSIGDGPPAGAGRGSTRRRPCGRPGSGGSPRRPARRRRAAGRRRRSTGSSRRTPRPGRASPATREPAGRPTRSVARPRCRPEPRPAGLVALDRLGDRRGRGRRDAARCGGCARWCRWHAIPTRRSSRFRGRPHQLVCVVGGAGAGAATGAGDAGAAALRSRAPTAAGRRRSARSDAGEQPPLGAPGADDERVVPDAR